MAFTINRLNKEEAAKATNEPNEKKSFWDHKRTGFVKKTMVLCIDGEGKNLKGTELTKKRKHSNWSFSREQIYTYLAASNSDGTFTKEVRNFGLGLTTLDTFKFIMSLPDDALIVGFAFNYDTNMLLNIFSEPRYRRYLTILHENGTVRWRGYTITHIPHKSLSISYTYSDGEKKTRTVWDSFSYFQMSFVKTLREWHIGTNEEVDIIAAMKDKRSEFDDEKDDDVAFYCLMECRLGAQLFEKVLENTRKIGLNLMRYDGAGSVAHAMLKKHNIAQYMIQKTNRLPDEVILSGYQGGRFDLTAFGHVGCAYEFDINSAYPYQALHLPCLSCGVWEYRKSYDERESWAIWFVSWDLDKSALWSPLPYRFSGHGEGYLRNGSGWYWANEVREAIKLYPASIQVHEGYTLRRDCEHQPFKYIEEYYRYRNELKGKGDLAEKMIKLGLNSLYGKLAQNVGRFRTIPKTQCYTWAGIITSNTRAMLLSLIRDDPDDALLVATDAVFKRSDFTDDRIGEGLGQWKPESMPWLFILTNGFYQSVYQRQDGSWGIKKNKTRGFPESFMYAPRQEVTDDISSFLQANNISIKGIHKQGTNHWKEIRDLARKSDRFDYSILRQDFITAGSAIKDDFANFDEWRRWVWRPHTLRYGEFDNKELRDGRVYPGDNPTPDVPSAPYAPDAYRFDEDVPVVSKN